MVALRRPRAVPVGRGSGSLFAAAYFLLPLYSTLQFSLQTGAHRYGLALVRRHPPRPEFRQSFVLSLRLALETVR